MSAAQYAAAFACIIMAFLVGLTLGQRAEKQRSAALTGFAAWVFHQLWITPNKRPLTVILTRDGGRYVAAALHVYPDGAKYRLHENRHQGDIA